MKEILINTNKKNEVIDITTRIQYELDEILDKSKNENGIVFINILHTTACITTADLDPGTDLDLLDALNTMIPNLKYRHPHNPDHVKDHIISSMVGSSYLAHYKKNRLVLGKWQRIVLIELDGPRERKLIVSVCTQN